MCVARYSLHRIVLVYFESLLSPSSAGKKPSKVVKTELNSKHHLGLSLESEECRRRLEGSYTSRLRIKGRIHQELQVAYTIS